MENTYVYKLRPFYENFFAGEWREHEEAYGFTQQQMDALKNCLIRGNTIIIREILKLINNGGGYRLEIIVENDNYIVSFFDGHILSQNDLAEYEFEPTLENIERYILEHVLEWTNISLNVIQEINRLENGVRTNIYIKPEECFVAIDAWKKAIKKIRKTNRLIKRNEVFLLDKVPIFNKDVAKIIARKTVFGKSGLRSVENDIKNVKCDIKNVKCDIIYLLRK